MNELEGVVGSLTPMALPTFPHCAFRSIRPRNLGILPPIFQPTSSDDPEGLRCSPTLDRRKALLNKACDTRGSPFPGQIQPMASVTGVPRAV